MCKDQNNCLSCKIFFVCFDFNLMAYCSRLREAVNIERNIERWTVLEKYSIGFFKIEKTQNRSSLVVKNNFTFYQLL